MTDMVLYGLFVAAVCLVAGGLAYAVGWILDITLALIAHLLGVNPDRDR